MRFPLYVYTIMSVSPGNPGGSGDDYLQVQPATGILSMRR